MNIKEITYERNRNLGNYQSEKVFLRADVDCDYDDILDSFEELKDIADRCLYPEKYAPIPETPEEKAELDEIFGAVSKPEDDPDLPW